MADKKQEMINRFLLVYQPNYWQGFACTVASISYRYKTNVKIDVIIEQEYVDHFNAIKTKYFSKNLKNIKFEYKTMKNEDLSILKSLSFRAHFSLSVCFRIYYLDLFECNELVCYLDTDTIFLTTGSDIGQFVSQEFPISARYEANINNKPYFNSGVIILNCRDKKDDLSALLNDAKKLLPALSKISIYPEQDALNIAFENRWKQLPSRLNRWPSDTGDDLDHCIAHAVGSRKPWMLGGRHAYTELYQAEMKRLKLPVYRRYHLFWQIIALKRRFKSLGTFLVYKLTHAEIK